MNVLYPSGSNFSLKSKIIMKNTKHVRKNRASRQAKSAVPGLNVALLRRVQRWIKKEPLRFRMGWWFSKERLKRQPNPPCNTTACIAGTALLLSGAKRISKQGSDVSIRAAKVLGLTKYEAHQLFTLSEWPTQFKNEYIEDGTPYWENPLTLREVKKNAKVALNRIEHFIKFGE